MDWTNGKRVEVFVNYYERGNYESCLLLLGLKKEVM